MKIKSIKNMDQKDEAQNASSFCICDSCDTFCTGIKQNCEFCKKEYMTYYSCDWDNIPKDKQ